MYKYFLFRYIYNFPIQKTLYFDKEKKKALKKLAGALLYVYFTFIFIFFNINNISIY